MDCCWSCFATPRAQKDLQKLDKIIQKRINIFIVEKILKSSNPRLSGKALTGDLKEFWSYRNGDYRMVVKIQDLEFTVSIIEIAHRRSIYG